MSSIINILAPAKINLFLHVNGKQQDGYHTLQSHVMFADYGDNLAIEEGDDYNLSITGDFLEKLKQSDNLVTKAVDSFCDLISKKPNLKITLEKNIPLGAGLGGGSADAAAVIKGLIKLWNIKTKSQTLDPLLLSLGADVPSCFYGQSCLIGGIGEHVKPLPAHPLNAVLVYPNVHCDTGVIFRHFKADYSQEIITPEYFKNKNSFFSFLQQQRNDLSQTTFYLFPEIKKCLAILEEQNNSILSRMSGSGSTCFGVFETQEDAQQAAKIIQKLCPDWWVKSVTLN